MNKTRLLSIGLGAMCATALGCAENAMGIESNNTPGGSTNVAQGGAQDFEQFRQIVLAGNVPSADTLDPVGFFAEHALDMPPADCGKDVCVHPFLAVAPKFNGGNWTMAYVTMNTAVDPSKLDQPPVHLAVVVEQSRFTGFEQGTLEAGASSLLSGLRPEDRVSVIAYGKNASRVALAMPPNDADLPGEVDAAGAAPTDFADGVGLYDGIAAAQQAFEDADADGFQGQHRVLLITSGHATAGITDPDHVIGLGASLVQQGTAFSVIGVGETFDEEIPSALGSLGAGTYTYALALADLQQVLGDEGKTSFFPLARDFTLEVLPAKGYTVGRIYGVHRATADESGATLEMPALFLGQRSGSTDVGGGRRGGGGGLFIELRADDDASAIGAGAKAFQVTADWKQAAGGAAQNVQTDVVNSLPPGDNPPDMWWNISDDSNGKPFMMLNMYLAFRGVVDFYEAGDCARALGVVDMMQTSVGGWLGKYSDTDITDDNNLMLKLRENVALACSGSATPVTPVEPRNFEGGCCFL